MYEIKYKEPAVYKNILPEDLFNELKKSLFETPKDVTSMSWEPVLKRWQLNYHPIMMKIFKQNIYDLAKNVFESSTLVPSYCMFTHYTKDGWLPKHKDDNACTYSIDMCLYSNNDWPVYVEDKPYIIKENEALAHYGNEQEHWREGTCGEGNYAGMLFFHFVEPDHWWVTKGPEYVNVVKNRMTEEEWEAQYGRTKTS
jgi:hypothetical protein